MSCFQPWRCTQFRGPGRPVAWPHADDQRGSQHRRPTGRDDPTRGCGTVARGRDAGRDLGHRRRAAPAGRTAGVGGLPRAGAGSAGRRAVAAVHHRDHTRVFGAHRAAVRADRGGPPGGAGRPAVQRTGRGDRLLHGWRIRVAGRRGRLTTWRRSTTARYPRMRPRCYAGPARSWPVTVAATAAGVKNLPGSRRHSPNGRSRPTSRCTRRPGTASSIDAINGPRRVPPADEDQPRRPGSGCGG